MPILILLFWFCILNALHILTREELNVGKLRPESFPPNGIFCVISVTAFKKGQSRNPQLFSHRLTLFPPLLRPLATTIAVGYLCTTATFLGISMLFALTVERFTFLSAQIVLTFTQTI